MIFSFSIWQQSQNSCYICRVSHLILTTTPTLHWKGRWKCCYVIIGRCGLPVKILIILRALVVECKVALYQTYNCMFEEMCKVEIMIMIASKCSSQSCLIEITTKFHNKA